MGAIRELLWPKPKKKNLVVNPDNYMDKAALYKYAALAYKLGFDSE
jgi:hypothetical protein